MAANVGSLNVRVGADITGLTEGMAKAQRTVQSGADSMSKSAKASAQIFVEAKRSADQLLGSVDPLYAAQVRYDRELERAQQLFKAGALSAGDLAKVQSGLKSQLQSSSTEMGRLSESGNNAKIGQMELGHAIRGATDSIAAGQSPLRAIGLEFGRATQSIGYLSGGTSKFGAFMSGPWGAALTTATLVIGPLIAKLLASHDAVGALVDKLKEQAQKTELSKEADDQWAKSIDGLIDRNQKLIDKLKERLHAEEDLTRQEQTGAQNDLATAQKELAAAQKALEDIKAKQRAQKGAPSGVGIGQGASTSSVDTAVLGAQVDAATERFKTAQKAVATAQAAVTQATISAGEDQARALTDSSAAVDKWAKDYVEALHVVEQSAPDKTVKIAAAFDVVKTALSAAAGAGVPFKNAANSAVDLARDLSSGKKNVDEYTAAMKKLADQLEEVVKAAKNVKKTDPISKFKEAVIGAEGTGQNPSSSAYGFGQFLAQQPGQPATEWQTYFKKLYADQAAGMTAAEIDALRDKKPIAEAIIDAATKDYIKVIKAAGQQITEASLYTVHLLGAGGAKKLFAASGDASARSVVGNAVANGNGNIFTGTVAQAKAEIARRIGASDSTVSNGASALQSIQDAAAKKQQEIADATVAAQEDFQKRSDTLDQQILAAHAQALGSYQARAETLNQEIDAEKATLDQAINTKAAEEKKVGVSAEVVDAESAILHEKVAQLTQEKHAAVAAKQYAQLIDDLKANFDQQKGFALEDLKFADSMATTQEEHRRLQLQMLDIQYQQKEYDLRTLLFKQQLAGATQQQLQNTLDQINRLPTEKAQAAQGVRQNTQTPLEAWAQSVPKSAAEINDALQSIEVKGLDGLAQAISGVITGTESLKSAFHDLAASVLSDLIQMTIKMLLFKVLSQAFGGSFGGGSSSIPSIPEGAIPSFDTGGSFAVLGNMGVDKNVLSLNGLPIANVSHGEKLTVGNDNDPGTVMSPTVHQHFDLRGAVMTEDLIRQMDDRANQAAESGARMGVDRMVDLNRRTFGKALR